MYWGMPALVDREDTYDSDDDATVPRLLSHDEMSFSSESESDFTTTTAESTDDELNIDFSDDDTVTGEVAFVLPEELVDDVEDAADDEVGDESGKWGMRMQAEMDKLDMEIVDYSEAEILMANTVSAASGFEPRAELLQDPSIWIGDTGALNHSTNCKHGSKNQRDTNVATIGITDGDVKATAMIDIGCMHCDKSITIKCYP